MGIPLRSSIVRSSDRRVLQFHKIIDKMTPSYLYSKLPPIKRIPVPLPNVFQEYECRTLRYKNSFFPDATASWNTILPNFEHFLTFSELKAFLISISKPDPNPIYGVFDSSHLRFIFQLRVGLSKLKRHKFLHNFCDTPSDLCHCGQGLEDTKHFLLDCLSYQTHRNILMTGVNNILNSTILQISTFSIFFFMGIQCSPQLTTILSY